jgi:hypothetical protein
MRIALPAVLLLFGSASVGAQAQTTSPATESATPVSVQAPAQPTPAAPPVSARAAAPAAPAAPAAAQTVARAEAATAVERTAVQERKRSRLVWFLVGAVVVLGIIVATQ